MTTTPKLPKAFKRKWVAALRSGKYEQGKGQLKADDAYCCLGVAAKISGTSDRRIGAKCMLETYMVPKTVLSVLDFSLKYHSWQNFLSVRNDSGWSFKRIATWIERNL